MAITTTTWMNGKTYGPAEDRSLIDGIMVTPGVDSHKSFVVSQTPSASMRVRVSSGHIFTQGTRVAHQGMYQSYNDGDILVEVDASSSTNNRIDLISYVVEDTAYTGVTPAIGKIIVTTGTPAQTPRRPNSPPDSNDLATILVKKGATSISNADIQPIVSRATALGGIAYAKNYQELYENVPRIDGLHAYRKDIDRLMRCDGVSWKYINTKPSSDTGWRPLGVQKRWQARPTEYRVYGDMVFTRGAIHQFQLNKANIGKYNPMAFINKGYAPKDRLQVLSGINSPYKQGIEIREDGGFYLYYHSTTHTWCVIGTSWLLD